MTDENVHRNIRELRIRLGMTQEEFAHAVAGGPHFHHQFWNALRVLPAQLLERPVLIEEHDVGAANGAWPAFNQ